MNTPTPMNRAELLAMFDAAAKEARALMERKNDDYADAKNNDVFGNLDACEALGVCPTEMGIIIRVLDKIRRMVTLLRQPAMVSDETIRDTALDVINYTVLLLAKQEARKNAAKHLTRQ